MKTYLPLLILLVSLTAFPAGKKAQQLELSYQYWRESSDSEKRSEIATQLALVDDIPEKKKCRSSKKYPFSRSSEILAREIMGISVPLISTKSVYSDTWYVSCFRCNLSSDCNQRQEEWQAKQELSEFAETFIAKSQLTVCHEQAVAYVVLDKEYNGQHEYKYDFNHCIKPDFDICPSFHLSTNGSSHLHKSCFAHAKNQAHLKLIEAKAKNLRTQAINKLSSCSELPWKFKQWKKFGFDGLDLITCMGDSDSPAHDPERSGLFHLPSFDLHQVRPNSFIHTEIEVTPPYYFWQSEVRRIIEKEVFDLDEAERLDLPLKKPFNVDYTQVEVALIEKIMAAILVDLQRQKNKGEYSAELAASWAKKCF